MSLLNKLEEPRSITTALAFSFSFYFALNTFYSALHSSKKLFTKLLKKLKKLKPIKPPFFIKKLFKQLFKGQLGAPILA